MLVALIKSEYISNAVSVSMAFGDWYFSTNAPITCHLNWEMSSSSQGKINLEFLNLAFIEFKLSRLESKRNYSYLLEHQFEHINRSNHCQLFLFTYEKQDNLGYMVWMCIGILNGFKYNPISKDLTWVQWLIEVVFKCVFYTASQTFWSWACIRLTLKHI